ncbi:MAG: hypothetical protein H6712_09660 [Myxococcales bacterium]|nr:hypothetical protein [Myxococcales bacterium]MCB9714110.1 hypothetical protein [Myxococcales bacterium]
MRRNQGITLGGIGFVVAASAGVLALPGCPGAADDICGPCGTIATGQLSISGNAQVDGFFNALADLQGATGSIQADFDANILALAEVYGVATAGVTVDAAFVDQVIGAIQADFSANISGGITVEYVPPQCSANVNVAVEAQASCEANAGCECEAMVDPGQVAVSCQGTCNGGCSAECNGEISCQAPSGGFMCEGACEGSCELMAAATCEGTCYGNCDGTCSLRNAAGECEGECSGNCQGTCEVTGGASCAGTCHGSCRGNFDPGGCGGEVQCHGECTGECSGSCEGSFTPPSASAECECEASADCQAQASAQAEANIECTPPSFELAFTFDAGVGFGGRAAFRARINELRARAVAILQGAARAQALINGEVNGEVVFSPAPFVRIQSEFQGLIDAGVSGDLDIAAGRLPCVIPAVREAVDIMAEIGTDFTASVNAQFAFTSFLLNP